MDRFVAYYRVSTAKQGRSGLGLDAQRRMVAEFLSGSAGGWPPVAEFVEVESGTKSDRPELQKAIRECRMTGAKLVIAKLDRLSRNAAFLLNLRDSGVEFVAADMPSANRMTVGVMALVAEEEARAISSRTKAALQSWRERNPGRKLGNPAGFGGVVYRNDGKAGGQARMRQADEFASLVGPTVREMQAAGMSLRAMAAKLGERGIKTANGGAWTATTVRNVLNRIVTAD